MIAKLIVTLVCGAVTVAVPTAGHIASVDGSAGAEIQVEGPSAPSVELPDAPEAPSITVERPRPKRPELPERPVATDPGDGRIGDDDLPPVDGRFDRPHRPAVQTDGGVHVEAEVDVKVRVG